MDGATNELAAAGYGRTGELKRIAEMFAKDLAEQLASDLHVQSIASERRWRGLPVRCSDWPEHLWERWCESVDSYPYSERDVIAMREPFIAEAAMRLDGAGFDCR